MKVYLDGSRMKSVGDFHLQMESVLDLGPHYGRNFAALHDRLSVDVERPVTLIWLDSARSRRSLGRKSFSRIIEIFDTAVRQDVEYGWTNRFTYELR